MITKPDIRTRGKTRPSSPMGVKRALILGEMGLPPFKSTGSQKPEGKIFTYRSKRRISQQKSSTQIKGHISWSCIKREDLCLANSKKSFRSPHERPQSDRFWISTLGSPPERLLPDVLKLDSCLYPLICKRPHQ